MDSNQGTAGFDRKARAEGEAASAKAGGPKRKTSGKAGGFLYRDGGI
jgi:hypothetical protein